VLRFVPTLVRDERLGSVGEHVAVSAPSRYCTVDEGETVITSVPNQLAVKDETLICDLLQLHVMNMLESSHW
jgi:hypothetical protein